MAIPILGALMSAAAPELAKRGLDILSGIFRGAAQQGTQKIVDKAMQKTSVDVSQQAEQVLALIEDSTGIKVADIAENKLTEDQWIKLKEFELKHEDQLQKTRESVSAYETEMEKLLNDDRKSARAAQLSRDSNEDPLVRRFIYYYAYLLTGLTFLFIFSVLVIPIDNGSDKWRLIDTVMGFLMGVGLSAIIQFFFGSSMGSRVKTEMLNKRAEEAQP